MREYFLYLPTLPLAGSPPFVSVHGISRNAFEHASRFVSFAESHRRVLIAPLFPSGRGGYQRLGLCGDGPRADWILDEILSEVGSLLQSGGDRFDLFGFSAGGQFAHRYAMAHPDRVLHLAVASAGWYTLPDPRLDFPLGIRSSAASRDVSFVASDFLRVPTRVFVGERDTHQGRSLRTSRKLNRLQGGTRLGRAERWVEAMRQAAHELGLKTRFELEILPNTGHSFRESMDCGGLGPKLADFLSEAPARL